MFRLVTYELRLVRDIVHGGKALVRRVAAAIEPMLAAVKEELRALPEDWLALFQLALIGLVEQGRDRVIAAQKALRKERRKERILRALRRRARHLHRDGQARVGVRPPVALPEVA